MSYPLTGIPNCFRVSTHDFSNMTTRRRGQLLQRSDVVVGSSLPLRHGSICGNIRRMPTAPPCRSKKKIESNKRSMEVTLLCRARSSARVQRPSQLFNVYSASMFANPMVAVTYVGAHGFIRTEASRGTDAGSRGMAESIRLPEGVEALPTVGPFLYRVTNTALLSAYFASITPGMARSSSIEFNLWVSTATV